MNLCLSVPIILSAFLATSVGEEIEVKEYEDIHVEDLKDLLMASMTNTIALTDIVTQQTQRISNTMLSLTAARSEIQDLKQKIVDSEAEMERLKAKTSDNEAEIQDLKETLNKTETEIHELKETVNTNGVEMQDVKETVGTNKAETVARLLELRNSTSQGMEGLKKEVQDVRDSILTENSVTVLNGEEANGNPRCAKVCSGTTGRSSTNWVDFWGNTGVYTDVDIRECGFIKIPTITTAVEGDTVHWEITGTSAVYTATPTGFRIYIGANRRGTRKGQATGWQWNVEWIAVGFTC